MLHGVHRRPPPSASRANTIRVTTGERPRTGMNEPKTEPRPRAKALLSRCGGRAVGRSSAACTAVTGRRQRFALHGSKSRRSLCAGHRPGTRIVGARRSTGSGVTVRRWLVPAEVSHGMRAPPTGRGQREAGRRKARSRPTDPEMTAERGDHYPAWRSGTAQCHAHPPQCAGTSLPGVVISAPGCG
jgi:hypothetical protein